MVVESCRCVVIGTRWINAEPYKPSSLASTAHQIPHALAAGAVDRRESVIERRQTVLDFCAAFAASHAQRPDPCIVGDGADGTVSEWVTQRLHKIVSMGSLHLRFQSLGSRDFR